MTPTPGPSPRRRFLAALPATVAGPALFVPEAVARPPVLSLWSRWLDGEDTVREIIETRDFSPAATAARLQIGLRHGPDLAPASPAIALPRAVLRDLLEQLPPRLAALAAPLVEVVEEDSWHAALQRVGQAPLA